MFLFYNIWYFWVHLFFSLQDSIELMFSLVLLFWWHHFFGGFLGSSHQVLVLWVCWLVFGIDILLMLFESFFIFSSMHLTTPSFVSFLTHRRFSFFVGRPFSLF